jgi:glycosyltransferase involved in cell wall biosynthesis
MRIGIDVREAFRSEPRGIGLYGRQLLREFATLAAGHEFRLYHQLPPPPLLELAANMRAVRCDWPGGRLHVFERLQLPWRLRRDRVDVHHGTYNTLPPRWRLWRGPPLVVTLHDVIAAYWPDDLADPFVRYVRAVTPRVVADAAVIVTVSEWSRQDIIARFHADPQKVRVVHNGIAEEYRRPVDAAAVAAAKARWTGDRPYLFAIGGGLERKNTGRLIDAFGQLRRRRADLPHRLVVTGLGIATDRFKARAAAAGCGDAVVFVPYLPRAEQVALCAGAALAVYPSLIEGWGLPIVEALAVGVPVIASNTSAMPESGGGFARHFDPSSPEAIATAIEQALADYVPAFAASRGPAMQRAWTFSWRRHAEQLLAIYAEAMR